MRIIAACSLALFLVFVAACTPRGGRAIFASDCNAPPRDAVTQVPLPGHPFDTVLSPDGCWAFVSIVSSNPRSPNGIAVLSRAGGTLVLRHTVTVESDIAGMVMTHDGKLLIGTDDPYLVFLDVEKLRRGDPDPVVGYLSHGGEPGTVFVNITKDDRFVFASEENNLAILVVDLAKARATNFGTASIVGWIPVENAPAALTFSPDDRWLYTTSQVARKRYKMPAECRQEEDTSPHPALVDPQGVIIVVDVYRATTDPAHAGLSRTPAGCHPVRLELTPDGKVAWVTARDSNALFAFDAAKLINDPAKARLAVVPVGVGPTGLAVVQNGTYVVVGNANRFADDQSVARTLSVIDAAKALAHRPAMAGSIPAGSYPRQIAKSPDGKTLFVSNYNSDTLEVIDVDRLPLGAAPGSTPR
jgi:6-phosphogluconolactonase (cycloisomerase 2 family)